MDVCLFLIAPPRASSSPDDAAAIDHAAITDVAATMAGLRRVVVHTPVPGGTRDPYLHDGAPPRCALQFYFDDLNKLEDVLRDGGAAHAFTDAARFPALAGAALTHQAMAVRRFPTPEPAPHENGGSRCTYLVSYEGPADDFNAWLAHYLDHHPPIMGRFPGIREIEIYTRVDYRGTLPGRRSNAMQRNKVVFDSPQALQHALASPVRQTMREDFQHFPPFGGETLHFPMLSVSQAF
ncbi:uncharacterized protein (TIGR02118 family) [Paraburkholderia caballeronis]|uniref:EthD family reductase n=1 Tax=Paraburkholderia caballeronis TaxID=416943 RepID=UPI00106474EA|nr:EthD family reductase [Paraburkholderia caballeronis]TDV37824.1 uncharacterized protein (TIGR02118 family) [Paraburkholderia caballeronis]